MTTEREKIIQLVNQCFPMDVKRWADSGEPVERAAPQDDGYPADQDEEMTIGLDCCPHMVPYGSDCDECDEEEADMAMGLTPNA